MSDRRVIVFRSRLREGVAEAYERAGEAMYGIVSKLPGFVRSKDFASDDGERVAIIEFASADELAAWRAHPEHAATQELGRKQFYSEYELTICSVVRESKFGAAGRVAHGEGDPAINERIARQWLAAFAARDLDALLALYADDAVHTSPKIRVRHPETGGKLRGKATMRAWWQDSFDRLPSMRYEPTAITASAKAVVMEYIRHVDGEAPYPVAETLDIAGGKIVASRVFHG